MLTKAKKQAVINSVKINDEDTGSPEAQVGILSERIEELSKHLKLNKQDRHSRRGLLKMVADRRTHLKYLQNKDLKRYTSLIKKLGLKK
ncbi:30S ribosomal protein S15 [Patescibacteria group bacterium]